MRIVNTVGIDTEVYNAILFYREQYKKSIEKYKSDISVTTLIKPPQIVQLEKRYDDQIEVEAVDMLYSLFGSVMHHILETVGGLNPNQFIEERLTMDVNGWTVSGMTDKYRMRDDKGILKDYKFTSVYAVKSVKPEWETQLNVLAELFRLHDFPVDELKIEAPLRDHSIMKGANPKKYGLYSYPKHGYKTLSVSLWPRRKCMDYIFERVRLHQHAEKQPDSLLQECTADERWAKPTYYKVYKKGKKRAESGSGQLTSIESAKEFCAKKNLDGTKYEIRVIPGESPRCEHYCDVNKFCHQYKRMKEINHEERS
jgi:hypothetical protein